ncbi:hypothetical protein BABINDRAFT_161787 [Babjeviella inositovora NRRL Y-12698]|uniref:Inner kinetochore subunit AME1 domain-containing protein n=1 Tax=Babjeviella inositovora NRRL Y-12698 TaxID=984486 RepID=A0A1E3QPJ8_9ASCO|nr:uncharacterized protein BABINDRAFT_161787 [Babjeviella inositovora NRRL Y-12698]ODQ79384.1 hypothetical protein BABINDRAFT_161787 [Babjeviella inositovora NRRL Y-12698]
MVNDKDVRREARKRGAALRKIQHEDIVIATPNQTSGNSRTSSIRRTRSTPTQLDRDKHNDDDDYLHIGPASARLTRKKTGKNVIPPNREEIGSLEVTPPSLKRGRGRPRKISLLPQGAVKSGGKETPGGSSTHTSTSRSGHKANGIDQVLGQSKKTNSLMSPLNRYVAPDLPRLRNSDIANAPPLQPFALNEQTTLVHKSPSPISEYPKGVPPRLTKKNINSTKENVSSSKNINASKKNPQAANRQLLSLNSFIKTRTKDDSPARRRLIAREQLLTARRGAGKANSAESAIKEQMPVLLETTGRGEKRRRLLVKPAKPDYILLIDAFLDSDSEYDSKEMTPANARPQELELNDSFDDEEYHNSQGEETERHASGLPEKKDARRQKVLVNKAISKPVQSSKTYATGRAKRQATKQPRTVAEPGSDNDDKDADYSIDETKTPSESLSQRILRNSRSKRHTSLEVKVKRLEVAAEESPAPEGLRSSQLHMHKVTTLDVLSQLIDEFLTLEAPKHSKSSRTSVATAIKPADQHALLTNYKHLINGHFGKLLDTLLSTDATTKKIRELAIKKKELRGGLLDIKKRRAEIVSRTELAREQYAAAERNYREMNLANSFFKSLHPETDEVMAEQNEPAEEPESAEVPTQVDQETSSGLGVEKEPPAPDVSIGLDDTLQSERPESSPMVTQSEGETAARSSPIPASITTSTVQEEEAFIVPVEFTTIATTSEPLLGEYTVLGTSSGSQLASCSLSVSLLELERRLNKLDRVINPHYGLYQKLVRLNEMLKEIDAAL